MWSEDLRVATVELDGDIIAERTLGRSGKRLILAVGEEERPRGGPAAGSILALIELGKDLPVAGYLPWINYYDVDELAGREPGAWRIVEPAERYRGIVWWAPYRTRGLTVGHLRALGLDASAIDDG